MRVSRVAFGRHFDKRHRLLLMRVIKTILQRLKLNLQCVVVLEWRNAMQSLSNVYMLLVLTVSISTGITPSKLGEPMSANDLPASEDLKKKLLHRLQQHIAYFNGELPERYVIAWTSFLAGYFEAGVLDFRHYSELLELLPKITLPDPIADIFIFEPAIQKAEALAPQANN